MSEEPKEQEGEQGTEPTQADVEEQEAKSKGGSDQVQGSAHTGAESAEELVKLLGEASTRIDQELKGFRDQQRSAAGKIKERARKLKERLASLSRAQGEGKEIERIPSAEILQTYGRVDFRSIEIGLRNSERRLSAMTNTYLQLARSYTRKTQSFNELLERTLEQEHTEKETGETRSADASHDEEDESDEESLSEESTLPDFTMEVKKTSPDEDEEPDDTGEDDDESDEGGEDQQDDEEQDASDTHKAHDEKLLQILLINRDHFYKSLADTAKWSNEVIEAHIGAALPGGYVIERDGRKPTPLISRQQAYGTPNSTSSKLPSIPRLRRLVNTIESTADHIERQLEPVEQAGGQIKELISQTQASIEQFKRSPTGEAFLADPKSLAVYRYIRGRFVGRVREIQRFQLNAAQAGIEYIEHCLGHYGAQRKQDQLQ